MSILPPHIPTAEPRMARVAAMVAEPARARMLCHLLSGASATASELARAASVTPATASSHLALLMDAGLLHCEPRGRHRWFRLADDDVAHALEALALVAERGAHERSWASPARQRLREARSCWGHLAGQLGVSVYAHGQTQGWWQTTSSGLQLSEAGGAGLKTWGLDGQIWLDQQQRWPDRRWAYPCMDWSERRDHLGGPLAKVLLTHFIERGWLRTRPGERALQLTPTAAPLLALMRTTHLPHEQTPKTGLP